MASRLKLIRMLQLMLRFYYQPKLSQPSRIQWQNLNRKKILAAKEKILCFNMLSITTFNHEIKIRRPTKAATVSHWSYLPPVTRETFMQRLDILIFLGLYNRRINRIQGNQVIGREHWAGSKCYRSSNENIRLRMTLSMTLQKNKIGKTVKVYAHWIEWKPTKQ